MMAATRGMPVRPLPGEGEAPAAIAGPGPAPGGAAPVASGLRNLLNRIFGGASIEPPARAAPYSAPGATPPRG